MKIYLFLSLFISSFRSQKVSGSEVRLYLSWGPRRGLGQGAAQHRDELPLPGRHGGAALERCLLDSGIRYWSAVNRARCLLGGGTWNQVVGGLRQRRQGTERGKEARTGRTSGGPGVGLYGRQEAIALAIDRLDELFAAPAVTNRLAHGFDRTLQRCIADELLRPDLLAQLLLGNDPVCIREQVDQDLEHFVPQPTDASGPAQLMALRVEDTLAEDVQHGATSTLCRADTSKSTIGCAYHGRCNQPVPSSMPAVCLNLQRRRYVSMAPVYYWGDCRKYQVCDRKFQSFFRI